MSETLANLGIALRNHALTNNRVAPTALNEVLDQEFESRNQRADLGEELELRRLAENQFFGFGKLQPLIDDS